MYGWDTTTYSNISTIIAVVTIVTLSVSSTLLAKVFPIRDSILGILGIVSLMAQNISRSLANREWIFYTSVGLGVFAGFSDITVRSQISKLVSKDEMGQVFMLYSILVCSTPVVGAIAVTQIYNASLGFFPGLYFAIATVWLLYPLAVFVWINRLEKRRL